MASTYLSRTPASAGNRKTWTWSAWLKMGVGSNGRVFSSGTSGTEKSEIAIAGITNTSGLNVRLRNDSGDGNKSVTLSALQRDPSAWYHIVVAVDTTQATDTNRIKIYINGELQTDFSSASYPSQNVDTYINSTNQHNVGALYDGSTSQYFDGQMAHVHLTDGTAYDADTFGETDATTGIWKPKTAPSVTYGTNGFFLKFENSGAFGTDSSGNGNTFTVNGTMTQTIDTPSNVFATMNPLDNYFQGSTFSNGNTSITTSTSNYSFNTSTLAVSKGKYYWEAKVGANSNLNNMVGIADRLTTSSTESVGLFTNSYSYSPYLGRLYENGSSTDSWGDSYTTNDIISVALDLDNNKLYFAKNGTWQNSANPSAGTGGISITAPSSTNSGVYFSAFGDYSGGVTPTDWLINFGNGYFGTTQVSSAENPDDGIGIFEYSVPTGYKALCTKSINAQEYD